MRSTLLLFLIINLYLVSPVYPGPVRDHSFFKKKKNSTVNTIIQDKKGLIWFGTTKGLVCFDGYRYQEHPDRTGNSGMITSLAVYNDSLLIGYKHGALSVFYNGLFRPLKYHATGESSEIKKILTATDGTIWIATYGNGVYAYSKNTWQHFDQTNGLSDDYAYTVSEDADKVIWTGTDAGITRFRKQNGKITYDRISATNGLPDNIVKDVYHTPDGNTYIAMQDSGVVIYAAKEKKFRKNRIRWTFGNIISLERTITDEIIIATEHAGLKLFPGYNQYMPLAGNPEIFSFFKDNENNFWVAGSSGCLQLIADRLEKWSRENGLPGDTVYSFLIDKENRYWLSSGKGIYYSGTGDKKNQTWNKIESSGSFKTICMFQASDKMIWTGSLEEGISIIDPRTAQVISRFNSGNGLASDAVVSITELNKEIWVSTLGGGVSKFSKKRNEWMITNYSTNNQLPTNYVYQLFVDSKKRLWLASDGEGLLLYTNDVFTSFSYESGLRSKTVYSIAEDGEGNIWVNNGEGNIMSFNGKRFKDHSNLSDSKETDAIIIKDSQDQIILVNSSGINLIKPGVDPQISAYPGSDQYSGFEPVMNSCFNDFNGNTWICTRNGLFKFRKAIKGVDDLLPQTRITSVSLLLDGKEIDQNTVIDHNNNNLSFQYAGIWYRSPEKVRYQYLLKGHDKTWSQPTESRTATFSNLAPGQYSFLVRASAGEIWNDPVSFNFEIAPPFSQTWWFYLLVTSLTTVSLMLIIKYRERQLVIEKNILESKVIHRTAEITMQKKVIEEKNKDITDSIEYAKRIQVALLPNEDKIDETFEESFILYLPKDIVSGDFYWFSRKGNKAVIAVADCTGHGVSGAFMSMIGYSLLNQIVNEKNITKPSVILESLDEGVRKILQQDSRSASSLDGIDLAVCTVSLNKNIVEFAGAMRPLYYFGTDGLKEIRGDKYQAGGIGNENKKFTNHRIEANSGDTFFIFSDGYADQFGGNREKKLTAKRFKEILKDSRNMTMSELREKLYREHISWKGQAEQVDDILVAGIRL